MIFLSDPVTNPFNNWLKDNAIYVAIGVAAVLLIVIGVLLILNRKKKSK